MTNPRRGSTPATDPDNIMVVWDDPALAAALAPAPPPERKPKRAN